MTKEVRSRTFKSGNSVALRLPKALGIEEGVEMTVREEQGRYVVEPVGTGHRRIDLDRIYGSCPGLKPVRRLRMAARAVDADGKRPRRG